MLMRLLPNLDQADYNDTVFIINWCEHPSS